MQKFSFYVITSPAFSPYSYTNIFKLTKYRNESYLSRIEYHPNIDLAQTEQLRIRMPLPREIVDHILDHLIMRYIQGMNFEAACQLIFISPSTVRRFYNRWFPIQTATRVTSQMFRISQTFELMQKIVDLMIQFPNEEHDYYVAISTQHTSYLFDEYKPYYPWNFNGNLELIQIAKPGVLNIDDFRAFITGPYITDIVWMNGRSDKGVVASTYFRLPVIVIVLTDREDEIIPTKEYIQNNIVFKNFSRLLKIAFGPSAGIFFAVQGEYIFNDQLLVEL